MTNFSKFQRPNQVFFEPESNKTDSTTIDTFVSREIFNNAIAHAMEDVNINMWIENENSAADLYRFANMFTEYVLNQFVPFVMELWDEQGNALDMEMDILHQDFSLHRITNLTSSLTNQITNSNDTITMDKELLSAVGLKDAASLFATLAVPEAAPALAASGVASDPDSLLLNYLLGGRLAPILHR